MLCLQARSLQAVPRLVKLFNHANQEVQRHATGAMRNLIYDNADNKLALVEENGIFELLRTLREQDDELRKNVTGAGATPLPVLRSGLRLPALSHLFPWSRGYPGAGLQCPGPGPRAARQLSPGGAAGRLPTPGPGGAPGEVTRFLPPSPGES